MIHGPWTARLALAGFGSYAGVCHYAVLAATPPINWAALLINGGT